MATVTGLRTFGGILDFDFQPSMSIMAKDINRMGLALESMQEPLERAVREIMIPSIQKNFDVGGRPSWEPLQPDTINQREIAGQGDKILVRSGALREGATSFNIWTINDRSATVRDLPSDIWYGKVHQGGIEGKGSSGGEMLARLGEVSFIGSGLTLADLASATKGSKQTATVPARPFIMIQAEDENKIEEVFGRWLDEKIAEFWIGRGLGLL